MASAGQAGSRGGSGFQQGASPVGSPHATRRRSVQAVPRRAAHNRGVCSGAGAAAGHRFLPNKANEAAQSAPPRPRTRVVAHAAALLGALHRGLEQRLNAGARGLRRRGGGAAGRLAGCTSGRAAAALWLQPQAAASQQQADNTVQPTRQPASQQKQPRRTKTYAPPAHLLDQGRGLIVRQLGPRLRALERHQEALVRLQKKGRKRGGGDRRQRGLARAPAGRRSAGAAQTSPARAVRSGSSEAWQQHPSSSGNSGSSQAPPAAARPGHPGTA